MCTSAAPNSSAARAIRTPIGPAPITNTRSSGRTQRAATCTAFASGSVSVASSSERSGGIGTADAAGTAKRSANPPGRSRPTSRPVAQWLMSPSRQSSHVPQATIGFNTTRRPTSDGSAPSPTTSTTPTVS
jgi:hypothetical protein